LRQPLSKARLGTGVIGFGSVRKLNDAVKTSTAWDANRVVVRSRTCSFTRLTQNPDYAPDGAPVYAYGEKGCTDGAVLTGPFCVRNCPGGATAEERVELPSLPEILNNLNPPLPTPRLSPPLDSVRRSNIGGYLVGMPTYFAVSPESWVDIVVPPLTRGGATLRLTAQPKALEVSLGGETFECDGPGVIITKSNLDSASRDCSVVFENAVSETLRMRIRYENVYVAENYPLPLVIPVGEESFSPVLELTLPIVEVQPVLTAEN
jgi:hypothetical protein